MQCLSSAAAQEQAQDLVRTVEVQACFFMADPGFSVPVLKRRVFGPGQLQFELLKRLHGFLAKVPGFREIRLAHRFNEGQGCLGVPANYAQRKLAVFKEETPLLAVHL